MQIVLHVPSHTADANIHESSVLNTAIMHSVCVPFCVALLNLCAMTVHVVLFGWKHDLLVRPFQQNNKLTIPPPPLFVSSHRRKFAHITHYIPQQQDAFLAYFAKHSRKCYWVKCGWMKINSSGGLINDVVTKLETDICKTADGRTKVCVLRLCGFENSKYMFTNAWKTIFLGGREGELLILFLAEHLHVTTLGLQLFFAPCVYWEVLTAFYVCEEKPWIKQYMCSSLSSDIMQE